METKKNIFFKSILIGLLLFTLASQFVIFSKINEISQKTMSPEDFSSIGTMYEVAKNIGKKDGVLYENIDLMNISFKGEVYKTKRDENNTISLIVGDKSYNLVNEILLEELSKVANKPMEKDYDLIEALLFNFYRLEIEKEKGPIDTTNSPLNLSYVKPISETLKEKYVIVKMSSDFYDTVTYKLQINEMGIIIDEI